MSRPVKSIAGFIVVYRASLEEIASLDVPVIIPGETDMRKIYVRDETGKNVSQRKSAGSSGAAAIAEACRKMLADIRSHRVRVGSSNVYDRDNFKCNMITPEEEEYFQLRSDASYNLSEAQDRAKSAVAWKPMLDAPFVDQALEETRREHIKVRELLCSNLSILMTSSLLG